MLWFGRSAAGAVSRQNEDLNALRKPSWTESNLRYFHLALLFISSLNSVFSLILEETRQGKQVKCGSWSYRASTEAQQFSLPGDTVFLLLENTSTLHQERIAPSCALVAHQY